MPSDFTADYSGRSDDELLLLASDRASLTAEAGLALDAELRRRNLTESDRAKYQQFIKHNEQREARRRRKRAFGSRRERGSWVEIILGLLVIALISSAYLALPSRYHMRSDWQEGAVPVMFSSVSLTIFGRSLWRKVTFWISLVVSSAIHSLVVHAWIQRSGSLGRAQGKLAVLLGFVLFAAVYGTFWVFRRNFYGEEVQDHT